MIRGLFAFGVVLAALSGCTTARAPLTGPVPVVEPEALVGYTPLSRAIVAPEQLPNTGLRVGFVADSQIQTRSNYNRVRGYRGKIEDIAIQGAIRPPALDWAARSMLRRDLTQLAASGAKIIFFLGDGANNGCYDEFALGFADNATPRPNETSVLGLLAEFRRTSGIPVYFILGNHDILGAGSTSDVGKRKKFCEPEVSPNRYISKLEAMKWTDAFNRGNAGLPNAGHYHSNWDEAVLSRHCGSDSAKHARTPGCYLAAKVDTMIDGRSAQFLLLDTNDWDDVAASGLPFWQQEGIRGAMTFQDYPERAIVSQTTWFDENASQQVALRVALSHYDVGGLRYQILGRVFSQKSQMYLNLFADGRKPAKPLQAQAYVVTGHTHVREYGNLRHGFKMNCGWTWGSCSNTDRFSINELNIGSTTDYRSYATLAQFDPDPARSADFFYQRVEPRGCAQVWRAIERGIGWKALGVDTSNRYAYRDYKLREVQPIWANLAQYAGDDEHTLNCIGVYAAAVEAGKEGHLTGQGL
jgi:hypothetical protein